MWILEFEILDFWKLEFRIWNLELGILELGT